MTKQPALKHLGLGALDRALFVPVHDRDPGLAQLTYVVSAFTAHVD